MNCIERISHDPGTPDAWICVCGNTPIGQGFHPCDEQGKLIEPDLGWSGLCICDRCGRVIRSDTLEVVKIATPDWSLYD